MRRIIYSATRHEDGYDHAVYDDAGDDMVHMVSVDAFNHAAEIPDIDCSYTMSRADAGPIGIALACAYAEPSTSATLIDASATYFVSGLAEISIVPHTRSMRLVLRRGDGLADIAMSAAEARALSLTLLRAAADAEEDAE